MKLRNDLALDRMIHGTIAQPPISIAVNTPRRMLKYLGNREVISNEVMNQVRAESMGKKRDNLPFPNETELAEMFTQICARVHNAPQKKAAARPPGEVCHSATISRGFQRIFPYRGLDAAAPTTPKILTRSLKIGMNGSCQK